MTTIRHLDVVEIPVDAVVEENPPGRVGWYLRVFVRGAFARGSRYPAPPAGATRNVVQVLAGRYNDEDLVAALVVDVTAPTGGRPEPVMVRIPVGEGFEADVVVPELPWLAGVAAEFERLDEHHRRPALGYLAGRYGSPDPGDMVDQVVTVDRIVDTWLDSTRAERTNVEQVAPKLAEYLDRLADRRR